MSVILKKFLIENNYTNFNEQDLSLHLMTHPDNPSFRAMTDTLDYFGIENIAVNVPDNALDVLPNDFLTIVDLNGPQLVLATKKNNLIFTENEEGEKVKHSLTEFKKKWSHDIIAIEQTEPQSTIPNLKKYWFILPFLLLLVFVFIQEPSIIYLIKILLAASGLFISYLLVKEKMGYHSASVLNVCTSLPNSNCNDVINSKIGNITKDVSLADLSFLYFFVLLFNSLFLFNNLFTAGMLLLGLPVILLSIYYQGFVLKKWCLLCLGIVLILCLLNITLIWGNNLEISLFSTIEFLLVLAFAIPLFFYVKNLIETGKKDKQEIISSRRFKRNPELVKKIMEDAELVEDISVMENEIIIGDINAKHQIIAYTNPLCGYCKKAFESYMKINATNSNIKIVFRFNAQPDNLEASSTQISSRLIEIYHENGANEFINAYFSWFKDKNINNWLKKFSFPKNEMEYIELLKKHKHWANLNGISYTPATLVDYKVFPSSYGLDDLVYVVNDIMKI